MNFHFGIVEFEVIGLSVLVKVVPVQLEIEARQ